MNLFIIEEHTSQHIKNYLKSQYAISQYQFELNQKKTQIEDIEKYSLNLNDYILTEKVQS